MRKPEKVEKVDQLTKRFAEAKGAVFVDYRGLTVKDATELRASLRKVDASFAVTKNTLTKLAAREAGVDERVGALLEGPTAVAFMRGDPIEGAKVLLELGRRMPAVIVKGAFVEGHVLGAESARSLATIDSKETSVAKVAGLLQSPLSRTAYLLQAPLQRIAYALAERGRQAA